MEFIGRVDNYIFDEYTERVILKYIENNKPLYINNNVAFILDSWTEEIPEGIEIVYNRFWNRHIFSSKRTRLSASLIERILGKINKLDVPLTNNLLKGG